MALSTSPRNGDMTRLSHSQIISIGISYGLPSDHPAITSLINRSGMLTEHEVRERLNPNSMTNSRWENGTTLHVHAPFDRTFGGLSPVSVADVLLSSTWAETWYGIVAESKTLAFLDRDGSEIVRFHGAGCGNRTLAANAKLPICYYCSLATPGADLCGILMALEGVPDQPRTGRRGVSYGTMSFCREGNEWVHRFC